LSAYCTVLDYGLQIEANAHPGGIETSFI
jgi:hypothetical protein